MPVIEPIIYKYTYEYDVTKLIQLFTFKSQNPLLNMQTLHKIIIYLFSLFSLTIHPHILLANTLPHRIIRPGNETDYEALLAFKAAISYDPASALSSWNTSLHFCEWEGIICGRKHMRIISLRLPSENLVGTLSPFIGNFTFLMSLDLYANSFHGDIPRQISSLSSLQILSLRKNSFQGEIPSNLSSCWKLLVLDLTVNKLSGSIPTKVATLPNLIHFRLEDNNLSGSLEAIGIGNMSISLESLYLDQNPLLQGSIPDDIGGLRNLNDLVLGDSELLSGTIPASLYNLSSLQYLYLSRSGFRGHLPLDLGLRLPNLRGLYVSTTSLSGQLPTSLSNLSLIVLDISHNSFTGPFFFNGNNWPLLSVLFVDSAFSLGREATDISFLDSLTNCTKLALLSASDCSLTGILPRSVANFSTTLNQFILHNNYISGQLPPGLGKFANLSLFDLTDNNLSGTIPAEMGEMKRLELLYLAYNNFSGAIPSSFGNLSHLSKLDMYNNSLEGPLPASLGNCQNLGTISLAYNKLSGGLPVEVFRASSLVSIDVSENNLKGSLPAEISKVQQLVLLDVSHNRFSSEIPTTLGACTSLTSLDLSVNSFYGPIPDSLSSLKSIQYLDLSCNSISGPIPSYLSNWTHLSSLNLSFNAFEGEVPIDGVFANTSDVSIAGNSELCGGRIQLHLPKCPPKRRSRKGRLSLAIIIVIVVASVLAVATLITLCFYLLCGSRKRKNTPSGLEDINTLPEVSYQMLSRATNGFSPSNLLGASEFGSVYKGILHQDDTEKVVAVKVMKLHSDGASKSFIAECKALRNIRHRNLVKIITACSSIDNLRNDFKALVFEFIPRGSLENWLHTPNQFTNENGDDDQSCCLSLFQRLSIAIDVGCALEYLHIGCPNSIIHCDLKPSNILLDDDMTAHVGDFGLAKFISGTSSSSTVNNTSSTQVKGTVGYAAPEYGLGSDVSREGDIYSFGIVVLEMMTSKKPTDPMFNNGLNLHDFAKSALLNRVMEIIDQTMLGDASLLPARSVGDMKKMECIKSLIMIGVQCSVESPQERKKISNVVNDLKSARRYLLHA